MKKMVSDVRLLNAFPQSILALTQYIDFDWKIGTVKKLCSQLILRYVKEGGSFEKLFQAFLRFTTDAATEPNIEKVASTDKHLGAYGIPEKTILEKIKIFFEPIMGHPKLSQKSTPAFLSSQMQTVCRRCPIEGKYYLIPALEFLASLGGDYKITTPNNETLLHLFLQNCAEIGAKSPSRRTTSGLEAQDREVLGFLLKQKVPLDTKAKIEAETQEMTIFDFVAKWNMRNPTHLSGHNALFLELPETRPLIQAARGRYMMQGLIDGSFKPKGMYEDKQLVHSSGIHKSASESAIILCKHYLFPLLKSENNRMFIAEIEKSEQHYHKLIISILNSTECHELKRNAINAFATKLIKQLKPEIIKKIQELYLEVDPELANPEVFKTRPAFIALFANLYNPKTYLQKQTWCEDFWDLKTFQAWRWLCKTRPAFSVNDRDGGSKLAINDILTIVLLAIEDAKNYDNDEKRTDVFNSLVKQLSELQTEYKDLDPTGRKDLYGCAQGTLPKLVQVLADSGHPLVHLSYMSSTNLPNFLWDFVAMKFLNMTAAEKTKFITDITSGENKWHIPDAYLSQLEPEFRKNTDVTYGLAKKLITDDNVHVLFTLEFPFHHFREIARYILQGLMADFYDRKFLESPESVQQAIMADSQNNKLSESFIQQFQDEFLALPVIEEIIPVIDSQDREEALKLIKILSFNEALPLERCTGIVKLFENVKSASIDHDRKRKRVEGEIGTDARISPSIETARDASNKSPSDTAAQSSSSDSDKESQMDETGDVRKEDASPKTDEDMNEPQRKARKFA